MDPFPAEHDLIGLLGEPILTDAAVPWAYNRLEFRQVVGDASVDVVIEPGESHVEVRLTVGHSERVSLDLARVSGIEVVAITGLEELVVTVDGQVSPLRLRVRPALRMLWVV